MMNAPSASLYSRALSRGRGRGALPVAAAFLFLLALSFAQIPPVWTSGVFGDTDDAMRMVQVRDLIAGQSWFDLTQRRMAPPEGAPMHWTRAVDAPLAVFFRLFALGLEPPRAEAAARLLYSGLLLILLLVACARFARTLMGARGRAPVLVSFALSGAVFGQFIWGRVDHHGLQLALLILLLDAALRALDPQRPRAAAVTACVGVISLCVSAENAPLVAAAFAIAPLRWAADGQGRSALGYCACGLGLALPLAALVFIPAGAQAARACDAFSYAYLFAGVCGGAVLATLWAMAPRLRAASARALALVFAGALAVLCVALLFPDCLRHPYGAIDPLVRELWLGNVPEARSFAALWREDPIDALALAAPLAFAAGGIALAVMRAQGLARLRWIALAGVGLVACALVALEVRSFWQALFTLAWGASYAALRAARRWRAPWLAFALVIAASPMFWALGKSLMQKTPAPQTSAACYAPESFGALARLAPGRVLAPINLGAHVLAHTHHDVLGGAYHRLSQANRNLIEMFLAAPDEARALLARAGVRYVAICFDAHTLSAFTRRAPQGLAATLAHDDARVDWLRKLSIKDAPIRVYDLR